MSENKRKPMTQKTRFEVFKRDSFTCQYCGRASHDVTLEVDHIHPVASGGGNDLMNLITACYECNHGKGARLLSDNAEVVKQKARLDEMNERRIQFEMLLKWRRELETLVEKQVDEIGKVVNKLTSQTLTQIGRTAIEKLIKRFGFQEVMEATEISFSKYDKDYAFDKIGGICYNRMHGIKGK